MPTGVRSLDFYRHAFTAVLLRQWKNEDGTIHVAELAIGDALFHIHEEKPEAGQFSPLSSRGTTVLVGLFVEDVDQVMNRALEAGGELVAPAQSYDYGYRQGEIRDPFGHVWLIESKI
jgi:PhnB protein